MGDNGNIQGTDRQRLMTMHPEYYTTKEAAEILQVRITDIYMLVALHEIECVQYVKRGRIRFAREDIDRYIQKKQDATD
ncbi:DNA binding domain, excisionase family [Bacteroidales bacterium Barb4]|nr:DNA binding domain, excisionase family [Bacteroidales bacterium Barb4]